jgi:hypothetical protein
MKKSHKEDRKDQEGIDLFNYVEFCFIIFFMMRQTQICEYCQQVILSSHKARHIKKNHPEKFRPQSNKGDCVCPVCFKIMYKTHVKRHLVFAHKADKSIRIRFKEK